MDLWQFQPRAISVCWKEIGDSLMNPEMVIAFGIFTTMFVANALNWTIGGVFMRWVGVMARILNLNCCRWCCC